jgi:hypothetical protein
MQTCLVDFTVAQNQRGLTVDLPQALHVYLRLWSHRAMSDRTAMCLRSLAWHCNSRRKKGVALRRNFMLLITALPASRELDRPQFVTRVAHMRVFSSDTSPHMYLIGAGVMFFGQQEARGEL